LSWMMDTNLIRLDSFGLCVLSTRQVCHCLSMEHCREKKSKMWNATVTNIYFNNTPCNNNYHYYWVIVHW
jgi:hypothetical protein